MNQLILALLLAFVSTQAQAEWIKVGNTVDVDVYIDSKSIRESRITGQLWVLYDFNAVQRANDAPYLSYKSLTQYQCPTKTTKMLVSTTYDGHATTGKIMDTFKGAAKDLPIPDQRIAESLWQLVCRQSAEL